MVWVSVPKARATHVEVLQPRPQAALCLFGRGLLLASPLFGEQLLDLSLLSQPIGRLAVAPQLLGHLCIGLSLALPPLLPPILLVSKSLRFVALAIPLGQPSIDLFFHTALVFPALGLLSPAHPLSYFFSMTLFSLSPSLICASQSLRLGHDVPLFFDASLLCPAAFLFFLLLNVALVFHPAKLP